MSGQTEKDLAWSKAETLAALATVTELEARAEKAEAALAEATNLAHVDRAALMTLRGELDRAQLEVSAVRDAARSMSDADGYPNDGSGPVAYMHKLRNMVAMLTNRAREDDRARATALLRWATEEGELVGAAAKGGEK